MRSAFGFVLAVVVVIASLASPAAAERKTLREAGASFVVPTGWKTVEKRVDNEGILIALSQDEEASLIFAIANAANFEKAAGSLDTLVAKFVTGAKLDRAKKLTIDGMQAIAAGGDGRVKNTPVKLVVFVMATPTNKALFVIGIVNAAKAKAYRKTLDEVIAGIKAKR